MGRARLPVLGIALLTLTGSGAFAADDTRAVTDRLDQLLARRWSAHGIKPAAPADDAQFVRRLFLDLAGRIPSINEVHDFLDDDRPDKRRIWTERILQDRAYVRHFARVWRTLLLGRGNAEQPRGLAPGFERWWRERLEKNVGYDQIVRELITAPTRGDGMASAFYQANEFSPAHLAGSTSRLFLGVRLECAECHKHPNGTWTRQQFWEYAAFFAGINPQGGETADRHEIAIPGTSDVARARFLDGTQPSWPAGANARATLAEWMTRPNNPYFARAAVNHVWRYFFGTGLDEPGQETSDDPAGNREIHDFLAQAFVAHGYDLKFLIRVITASRAYQLTSARTGAGQEDVQVFARMAVRALSPEQLFDSVAEATEFHDPFSDGETPVYSEEMGATPRAEFLAKFPPQENPADPETSIQQALFLMNGKFMADATTLERSKPLTTIAESVGTSTARRIETLYLLTLSRKPRPEESARLVKYVESGGATHDRKKALADIFWALLNSGEFIHNH